MAGELQPKRFVRVALVMLSIALSYLTAITRLSRTADVSLSGEDSSLASLADHVARDLRSNVRAADFHTGSALYSGEWALLHQSFGALGFGQMLADHLDGRVTLSNERRLAYAEALLTAASGAASERTLGFGSSSYNVSIGRDDNPQHGHAYVGYANLPLSVLRYLFARDPTLFEHLNVESALARNLELTQALALRFAAAQSCWIETYPGEGYPADITAALASVVMFERAERFANDSVASDSQTVALVPLEACKASFGAALVDGFLPQAVEPITGRPVDSPRGSGTSIAAYLWSFADFDFARTLTEGLLRHTDSVLGFSLVSEYLRESRGWGDIDSGPVLLGYSVTATGGAMGPFRQHGFLNEHRGVARLASFWGLETFTFEAPNLVGTNFLVGGPAGNSVMLAMLSARRTAW